MHIALLCFVSFWSISAAQPPIISKPNIGNPNVLQQHIPSPKSCGDPHERWMDCGPPCGDRRCPTSSQVLNFKCQGQCGKSGCYCDQGLVRNNKGDCVSPDDCPTSCPSNEVFNQCGDGCEQRCPTSPSMSAQQQSRSCSCGNPSCTCQPDFYRTQQGHCVPLHQCPSFCPRNEIFNQCGDSCEPTCDDFASGKEKNCQRNCNTGKGECVCKPDFYRFRGQCVPPSQCPRPRCPNHEHWVNCAPPKMCQQHCGRSPGFCHQQNDFCRGGCVCDQGWVRDNSHFEQCIRRDNCKRN